MDFRILGPLEVVSDAGRVNLGGDRQRHVLAMLIVHRGRVVSTDSLVSEVWGDSPPVSALTSLQMAVSKLRKAIGADAIQTRPGGYQFLAEDRAVDAGRFERALEDGHALVARGDAAGAARLLRQALSEWRGDVLAGIDPSESLAADIARLNELRWDAVEDLMAAQLDAGRHAQVIGELAELVAAQPFRERLHAHLIVALYRAGRQAEALEVYSRLRETLLEELGVDPSPDLVTLEQRVLRQDPDLAGPSRGLRLARVPTPPTELIGRDSELTELRALIAGGARLVSLTGAGGVGKTRLMLAVADVMLADLAEDWEEIVFVDLAPLTNPDLVLPTIANALSIVEQGDSPLLDKLTDALRGRRSVLLLDNFETVLGASPVVSTIIARCPRVCVVVTSRERLSLTGEREFVVGPLPLPQHDVTDVEDIERSPAVQLFCDRAQAVQRDFSLTSANAAAIADLCRRLDGLPLALELAGARVKLLAPSALVDRLHRDPRRVLSGGARDLPERHRALETTIAWSYDGLTEDEQHVLHACSIFSSGASIEGLEHVCVDVVQEDMLDLVSSLLDKSLLVRQSIDSDVPRLTMMETIRSFAMRRLAATGELAQTRDRHADHVALLVGPARVGIWREPDRWIELLDAEIDNIRSAADWLLSENQRARAARMLADIAEYWVHRGALAEGEHWLTLALDACPNDAVLVAELQVQLGKLAASRGDHLQAIAFIDKALPALGSSPMLRSVALCYRNHSLWFVGRYPEAIEAAEEAVELAGDLAIPLLSAYALTMLGVSCAEFGAPDRGLALLREASVLTAGHRAHRMTFIIEVNLSWVEIQASRYTEARDRLLPLMSLGAVTDRELEMQQNLRTNLGWAMLGTGQAREAMPHFLSALRLGERIGDETVVAEALVGVGCAATSMRIPTLPGLCFGRAARLLEESESTLLPHVAAMESQSRAKHDAKELADAQATGGGLTVQDILSRAQAVLAAEERAVRTGAV